jgi:hypothetical protein
MIKKNTPGTSSQVSTYPVEPIYMTKKAALETSPRGSTWPVQAIYMMKKIAPLISTIDLHGLYSIYIW